MTRIVAGSAKGLSIAVPAGGTRPTAERVREAWFNALESEERLDGARVLDLYAGSGALGFEALSRGAAQVTFVEADRRAVGVLQRNAATLRFEDAVAVRTGRVESVLLAEATQSFDLVLADPPYALPDATLDSALLALVTRGWTAPGTAVIIERPRRGGGLAWPPPLTEVRARRYGDSVLYWAEHRMP